MTMLFLIMSVIAIILALVYLNKNTVIRKLEYKYNTENKHFHKILVEIISMIENNKDFSYVYNEPGTGDIDYWCEEKDITISFNEFPEYFTGFYINGIEVKMGDIIELNKCRCDSSQ